MCAGTIPDPGSTFYNRIAIGAFRLPRPPCNRFHRHFPNRGIFGNWQADVSFRVDNANYSINRPQNQYSHRGGNEALMFPVSDGRHNDLLQLGFANFFSLLVSLHNLVTTNGMHLTNITGRGLQTSCSRAMFNPEDNERPFATEMGDI